jgi:hypothetical protein
MKQLLTLLLLCLCASPIFAGENPKRTAVDPDDAYKNNCMRCHAAVRQYSPRQTATIVMHMRVRANITAEETQAILQYLADSEPAKLAPSTAHGTDDSLKNVAVLLRAETETQTQNKPRSSRVYP